MKIAGMMGRAALLLTLCLPPQGWAVDEFVEPEALAQRATELLQQGQEEAAAEIVSTLILRPNPPMQALFLSGQIAGNHGEWEMAVRYYRIMIERNPAMLRVRLELARALYMNGEFEAAERHFKLVLGEPRLPEAVRANVMTYIDQLEHQTFSQSLTLEWLNDSNINQGTASQSVPILGGQSGVLSWDARQNAGMGVGATWEGRYLFGDTRQFSWRGLVQHQNYPGATFDLTYTQSYLGVTKPWSRSHALTLEGGGQFVVYGGRKLYDGMAFRAADTWRNDEGLTLGVTLDSKQMLYPDYSYRDGWQHGLSMDASKALSAGASLSGGLNYGQNLARETGYSFIANGAKVGGMAELPWSLIASATVDYLHSKYQGVDPNAGVVRVEHRVWAELGLMSRALAWEGFAPRLVLGNARNRSNAELYSYRKSYLKVIFTREF